MSYVMMQLAGRGGRQVQAGAFHPPQPLVRAFRRFMLLKRSKPVLTGLQSDA